tara:strand:- start:1411 stop:2427 length:1017 start_codon:yes stop_codon:yes gene_type:complete
MDKKSPLPARLCLSLLAACIMLCACSTQAETADESSHTDMSQHSSSSKIQGMWVWREAWINTDQAQDKLLDFCERHGFNRLFVQIHNDKQAKTYIIKYPKELARLVAEAGERGILIEALDGDHDMALAARQDDTLARLDALIDLNQSMPVGKRFVGIHYDIEPYVGEPWKAGQASRDVVMHDLLTFYVKARQKLNDRGSQMTLACDIPMWYDAKTAEDDHCIVSFNGETKNLHEHIQDLCDYIGIMSYRQHVVGSNSVSEHIANELAYARSINKTICASLETIELEDTPQITFFGKTPNEFWEQLKLLNQEHKDDPAYAGVLVHCYRGMLDLHAQSQD